MIGKNINNYFGFSLFILIASLILMPLKYAVAADYVDTPTVVKEIERTLLFSKSERQQLDFYKTKESGKKNGSKSDNVSSSDYGSELNIVVFDPKNSDSSLRDKEKMAYNYALIGQYEAAIELYKQVIKAEPNNLYAQFSLAVIYQKMNQGRQAKTLYYNLLKSDAENKDEIVGNLLAILVEESPKDAIYILSRLTAENPKSSYILAQAAIAYDKSKNYEQAIDLLKRAVAYDPDRVDYKYNLAVIYDKTSDYRNATSLYSEVLKKDDGSNQSIPFDQIKKRIEFLKK